MKKNICFSYFVFLTVFWFSSAKIKESSLWRPNGPNCYPAGLPTDFSFKIYHYSEKLIPNAHIKTNLNTTSVKPNDSSYDTYKDIMYDYLNAREPIAKAENNWFEFLSLIRYTRMESKAICNVAEVASIYKKKLLDLCIDQLEKKKGVGMIL